MEKGNSKRGRMDDENVEASSPRERYDKFQCRVGRGKANDLHVFQAGLADGGEDVIFCNLLLTLGIDDPERGSALHGFRYFGQSGEIFF